ncbi:ABC transporter substrate-binding protein [Tistrella bauzanensis]|uniref:ABC transporter substrate-binding protein n=1 Tax=Tistrella arctica TaxID=3133430 RepID=A0ABU9YPY8_9PROT
MKLNPIRTATAAVAATMIVAAAPAWAAGAKIGALMPLTGDLQAYGVASVTGAELALEEINSQGGLLGGKLGLEVADTQTNAQAGVDAAQRLVSVAGVNGLVGALSSGVSIPVATTVSATRSVPQISPASTSPVITSLDDKDFMFRSVPSDALQGTVMGKLAADEGYKTVSIMYINNDYGQGLAEEFTKTFEKNGGKIAASLAFEAGSASYRGELSNASKDGAEALVLIAYPENGTTVVRQALEEGLFSKFVFSDGLKAPEMSSAIGEEYLKDTVGIAPEALADSPAAKLFREAYEAKYKELPPKPYIDTTYDAVYVLALAMEKAGSTDGTKIRDALREVANAPGEKVMPGEWEKAVKLLKDGKDIDYVGASGSLDFDAAGDVSGTFAIYEFKNGTVETREIVEPKL